MPDMVALAEREAEKVESPLFLRPAPSQNLAELLDSLPITDKILVNTDRIEFALEGNDTPTIRFNGREIPAEIESLLTLGSYLQIPAPFIKRIQPDERQFIFSSRIQYTPGTVEFEMDKDRLVSVISPGKRVIDPRDLVRMAQRVVHDKEAPVVDAYTGDMFGFDVITPTDFSLLGRPEVGDITKTGLRIQQNRKHNHAPTAMPFTYTLICTNGMEAYSERHKVDARGLSVEDVLVELEMKAQFAFAEAEEQVDALYALRSERVDNPERVINSMSREYGLSPRTVQALIERVPAVIQDDANATMFDVVNLITNHANRPGIRRPVAHELQRLGGQITSSHKSRCNHCKHSI